ncbi:hypothetical protein PV328_005759 [Microctonus aethiopoides]|uniref:Uncharacterized protein n=1 Tax=Microctonus aethiopoides TaxID=144406 RepID=A0AA39FMU2_9HYME|nr:hypothetical protein PV328_005759 [Microctonus aethiopoides]
MTFSYFSQVLKKTPRLKSLELQCVSIEKLSSIGGKKNLKALFIGMPTLKNIEFNNEIRENVKNLEILVLDDIKLVKLEDIIELITNYGTREGISPKIYKLLNKNTNLNNLELSCCGSRSCERCLKYLPTINLEHLSIFVGLPSLSIDKKMVKHAEKALSKMPKLKSLNFHNVS